MQCNPTVLNDILRIAHYTHVKLITVKSLVITHRQPGNKTLFLFNRGFISENQTLSVLCHCNLEDAFDYYDVKLNRHQNIQPRSAWLSTSIRACQYDLKADMPKPGSQKLFFDTHSVVRLLEENGFSTQQAEVIVKLLVRTTNSNMEAIYNDMVTKVQQEIVLQRVMSHIAAVKKDMIILEKSEFSTLLAENEKIKIQLLQLKVQLADVMNKVRSDTILDMNLEKSHVKEMKAEHEKKLLETRTEIMEMTAEQDRHLAQTNMKIDTEVAGLKTMLESHKLDTIKYLAGSVFTCLTVVLGFYRIWM
uniref:Mitochondrial calcium uniporter regulator 1 n=1 Tax=Myripristis murdjan TaxID=586833 RepID=A0A667X951_9TELE